MKKTQISKISTDWKRVEEWDFSSVPDEQIKSCLLYEYAREKIRRSDDLRKKLESWEQGMMDFDLWKMINSPEGYVIFTPTMLEEPWIEYIKKEKKKWGSKWKFEAFEREHKSPGFAAFFQKSTDISYFMDFWTRWNQAQKADTAEFELGCFCIDWNHTDADIKEAFNCWLDDRSRRKQAWDGMSLKERAEEVGRMASPRSIIDIFQESKQDRKTSKRVCKYSNRGKSLRLDMARAYLKSLGAFRLQKLAGMRREDAVTYSRKKSLHRVDIFTNPENRNKVGSDDDWYGSKIHVENNLKKLFPE